MQHSVIQAAQPYGLGLNETLMPQYLKELGYATHAVGKVRNTKIIADTTTSCQSSNIFFFPLLTYGDLGQLVGIDTCILYWGGGTPLYRLCVYVRCQRVWFFTPFGLKSGKVLYTLLKQA